MPSERADERRAVAICATDLEIIHHGPPALIQGGQPFNKNFTPGHEYSDPGEGRCSNERP